MDFRAGDDGSGAAVDHGDDGDEAFLAEDAAVLEVGVGDRAHAGPVHVDKSAFDLADHPRLAVAQVHHGAVVGQDNVLFRDAGGGGEPAVGDQVPGFAVHRHGIPGTQDVVAVEQLAGGGMSGDVDLGVALVHHVGAEPHESVDDAEDGVFVARDQGGGEDDGVALADADAVVAVGHPGQGRHGLALGSGGHQHHLVVRQVVDVLQVDEDPVGHVQVAQFLGDGHVPDHRAAHEADEASVRGGGVEDLLHAVDVG